MAPLLSDGERSSDAPEVVSVFFYASRGSEAGDMLSPPVVTSRLRTFALLASCPAAAGLYIRAAETGEWEEARSIEMTCSGPTEEVNGAQELLDAVKGEKVEVGFSSAFMRVHDLPQEEARKVLGCLKKHAKLLSAVLSVTRLTDHTNPLIVKTAPKLARGLPSSSVGDGSSTIVRVDGGRVLCAAFVLEAPAAVSRARGGDDARCLAAGARRLLADEGVASAALRILFFDARTALYLPNLVSDAGSRAWLDSTAVALDRVLGKVEGIKRDSYAFWHPTKQWFFVAAWSDEVFKVVVDLVRDYGYDRNLFSDPTVSSSDPTV
jgi:hypothetical protein